MVRRGPQNMSKERMLLDLLFKMKAFLHLLHILERQLVRDARPHVQDSLSSQCAMQPPSSNSSYRDRWLTCLIFRILQSQNNTMGSHQIFFMEVGPGTSSARSLYRMLAHSGHTHFSLTSKSSLWPFVRSIQSSSRCQARLWSRFGRANTASPSSQVSLLNCDPI